MITNTTIPEMSFASGTILQSGNAANAKTTTTTTNNNNDCYNKNVVVGMTSSSPNGYHHRFYGTTNDVSSENTKETGPNVIAVMNGTNRTTSAFSSHSKNLNSLKPGSSSASRSSSESAASPPKRIQLNRDQASALQSITDVHNYAKLNRYNSSYATTNCRMMVSSSNSSNQDDDEEEEEEEDDDEDTEEDEEDDDDDDDAEYIVDFDYDEIRKPSLAGAKRKAANATVKGGAPTMKAARKETVTVLEVEVIKSPATPESVGEEDVGHSKIAPEHHARRPMNAFLIFCKRHRAIVRDKHKHLENRSITKILGDWWASLDTVEKTCYTNLAKQYKDAFLSANPNFKWYKLPAPALRTLNTRPTNGDNHDTFEYATIESPPQLDHHYSKPIGGSANMSVFKFADETQLGGLSALLNAGDRSPTPSDANNETERGSHLALDMGQTKSQPFANMQAHALHMTNGGGGAIKRDSSFSSSEDDLNNFGKKSSRSCKGKKYQELMNSGQLACVVKKSKATKTKVVAVEAVVATVKSSPDSSSDSNDNKMIIVDSPEPAAAPKPAALDSPHKFDTISFDLEEKIKALPALCFDDYVQRKRSTKKKKKINSKKRTNSGSSGGAAAMQRKSTTGPATALEAKEQIVGSQKRKARKESITRRDVNAIQNEVQLMESFVQDLNGAIAKPTTPTSTTPNSNTLNPDNNATTTSDLLILAEVATNHIDIKKN